MKTQPSDFRFDGDRVTLPDGWYVEFKSEYDQDSGPPWEECDGHGPISDWVQRDKHAGERVLWSDGFVRRLYDFAEAMKIAKRDRWGLNDAELAKLTKAVNTKSKTKDLGHRRGDDSSQGVTITAINEAVRKHMHETGEKNFSVAYASVRQAKPDLFKQEETKDGE